MPFLGMFALAILSTLAAVAGIIIFYNPNCGYVRTSYYYDDYGGYNNASDHFVPCYYSFSGLFD